MRSILRYQSDAKSAKETDDRRPAGNFYSMAIHLAAIEDTDAYRHRAEDEDRIEFA